MEAISLSRPFPSIPSELILHILKFLTNPHDLRSAILVCKLWCYCGMDLLWSRPALLSLDLVHKMGETLSKDPSETVFPYASYIRRLNFSFLGKDLTDAQVVQFHNCTRLERLLLPACSKTTEEGLMQILLSGRGLYTLDLTEIPAVTDEVIGYVAQHCPKLHTLYLTGCSAITDDSVVKLAASCTSLKRIKLAQCQLLTDRSVLALAQHCPQLMEIDITNCNLMTNSAIQSVFQTLPQIRDINMTLLNSLTDQAFASIPLNPLPSSSSTIRYEQLRVLNLTSCTHITDETLTRLIPAAPRLRNLALTKCDRITDVGVSAIKLLGKHLHYLHLGHCSKLTDKSIKTLTQHCTRIRYLDLACCSKLTDEAVFAMAQLPKLRRIGLVKCSNITDDGIYAMLLSQIVPQTLERVHLSYCVHLSDAAVAALVKQCTKLTHLSVTGVPAFMSPKYQKFCRIPPSEFTPHQREVFCVFSGKGVRELRQFMQENPVPSSTPSTVQRSYRLMGSTVASMVAGGSHSATIGAHLGLGLGLGLAPGIGPRETEAQVQNLAVQGALDVQGGISGASSSSSSVHEEESGAATAADPSMVVRSSSPSLSVTALLNSAVGASYAQHQRELEALELEQQLEELDPDYDYGEMMMRQQLLQRHHDRHHRHAPLAQHHHYYHHSRHQGSCEHGSGSSAAAAAAAVSTSSSSSSSPLSSRPGSAAADSTSRPRLTSSNTPLTKIAPGVHLPTCPHYRTTCSRSHHHDAQDHGE
ncbi:SCF ubiquitin ligase complex subunit, partial [Mortierella sp. NVP85]